MNLIFGLALVCASIKLSRFQCVLEKEFFCSSIPNAFPEGLASVVFVVTNLGVINATVFRSASLASVTSLALANSGITEIKLGAFAAFYNLAKLSLYQNSLTEVTAAWLSNPGRLENLTVAQNLITKIRPNTFSGFFNLTALNLANNQISQIAAGSFTGLVKLALLDLSNNNLTTLKRNAFSGLKPLAMKLGGNPWNCSCDLHDFRSFLQELMNASLLEDAASVVCHSPPSLKGICVWNVSDLNCPVDFLSPVFGNSFHKIGLPVLLACLVSLPFILVLFSIWLLKHNSKQVEPNAVVPKPTSAVKLGTQLDSVAKLGESDGKARTAEMSLPSRPKMLKVRVSSASAILLHTEFHSRQWPITNSDCKSQDQATTYMSIDDKVSVRNKDLCSCRVLWSYDQLEEHNREKIQSPYTITPAIHRERTDTSVSSKASKHILQTTENDDMKDCKTTETPEPFLYLSVATATEEQVSNEPQRDVVFKPVQSQLASLKRVLTWPYESRLRGQQLRALSIRKSFVTQFFLPALERRESLDIRGPECRREWLRMNSGKAQQLHEGGKLELSEEAQLTKEAEGSEIAVAGTCSSFEFSEELQRQCDISLSARKNNSRYNGRPELRTETILMGQPEPPPLQKEPPVGIATSCAYTLHSGLRATTCPRGMKNRSLPNAAASQTRIHHERSPSSALLESNALGSSYDDTLPENSSYNYVNLLHEVVENRGRWTRERWKQTHQKRVICHPPTRFK